MGLAAIVYAELLSLHQHGYPLWWPEPRKGLDGCIREIQLGDVGYLDSSRGEFRPLFNITVGRDHELNKGGVPEEFTPVVFNPALRCSNEDALGAGELCSEGVEHVHAEGAAGANFPANTGMNASCIVKCSVHRGAFLCLKDSATEDWITPNAQFIEYMRQHHSRWCDFARDPQKLGLRCKPEDIILVRGTMKTSSWTLGAFPGQKQRARDVSAEAHVASVVKAKLRVSTEHTTSQKCEQRSGPRRRRSRPPYSASSRPSGVDADAMDVQDDRLARDQCVFLSYYKIKWRSLMPKKIEAHADPPRLDRDQDDSYSSAVPTMEMTVNQDIDHIPPPTPVDDLLDYILESSNVDVAIASSADIKALFPEGPVPTDFLAALRDRQPQILIDGSQADRLEADGGGAKHEDVDPTSSTSSRQWGYLSNNSIRLESGRSVTIEPSHPYLIEISPLNPRTNPHRQKLSSQYFESIEFNTTQGRGVCLANVCNRDLEHYIIDANSPVLQGAGEKVTYRIDWPGYSTFSKQKYTMRRREGASNRLRVARHVGEIMDELIKYVRNNEPDGPPYHINHWQRLHGENALSFEDIYLLEVRQVSKAICVPIFASEYSSYQRRQMSHIVEEPVMRRIK